MAQHPHHAHFHRRLRWEELDREVLRHLIELARREDLEGHGLHFPASQPGDPTSDLLPADAIARTRLVARTQQVVCGLGLVPMVLEAYATPATVFTFQSATTDGTLLESGASLGEITGPARTILQAERVLLNFLQRLGGVATQTHTYVHALGASPTRILDTRKTTPGFRHLEKYAVACGGGWNHRLGLHDRYLLKDNHLAMAEQSEGALADLVHHAHKERPNLPLQVEVDRLDQIPPLLAAGVDALLLDNFSDEELREALTLIGNRCLTEASGGITLERLPRLAPMGLDFISSGALIHAAKWVDIGLDWVTSA